MPIDTAHEITEIIRQLNAANGYFDCERLVTNHIEKQLVNGAGFVQVKIYLRTVQEQLTAFNERGDGHINYSYAAAFVKLLITTSYWYSWIKQNKLNPATNTREVYD